MASSWYDLSCYVDDDFVLVSDVEETPETASAGYPATGAPHNDRHLREPKSAELETIDEHDCSEWFTVAHEDEGTSDFHGDRSTFGSSVAELRPQAASANCEEVCEESSDPKLEGAFAALLEEFASGVTVNDREVEHDQVALHAATYAEAARRAGGTADRLPRDNRASPDTPSVMTGCALGGNDRAHESGNATCYPANHDEDPCFSEEAGEDEGEEGDEEEWVLERLLKRRSCDAEESSGLLDHHHHQQHTNTAVQYLCKWKHSDDLTWEYRSTLEDAGYVALLDQFDYDRLPKKKGALSSECSENRARKGGSATVNLHATAATDRGHPLLQNCAYFFASQVSQRFHDHSPNAVTPLAIKKFSVIGNSVSERRFVSVARQVAKTSIAEVLFVRVPSRHIRQVVREGLRAAICAARGCAVDGKQMVWVTASPNPYAMLRDIPGDSGRTLLFACLGMVPRALGPNFPGSVSVDERLVVPLWLLETELRSASGSGGCQLVPRRSKVDALVSTVAGGQAPLSDLRRQQGQHQPHRDRFASFSGEELPRHIPIPTTKREVKQGPRAAKEHFHPTHRRKR